MLEVMVVEVHGGRSIGGRTHGGNHSQSHVATLGGSHAGNHGGSRWELFSELQKSEVAESSR